MKQAGEVTTGGSDDEDQVDYAVADGESDDDSDGEEDYKGAQQIWMATSL